MTLVADNLNWKDGMAILMGLTPREISDTRLIISSLKDQADFQKKIATYAETEFRRGFEAAAQEDWKKSDAHMARAKSYMVVLGDFKDDMIAETYKRATSESQTLVDRVRENFPKKGYKSQLPARLQRLFEQTGAKD